MKLEATKILSDYMNILWSPIYIERNTLIARTTVTMP